ncbi:hypothetical protein JCM5353_006930 [Sporobolomyces roseus]
MHLEREFIEFCQEAQTSINGTGLIEDDWRAGYGLLIEFFGFFPVPQDHAREIGTELEKHLSSTQARRQLSKQRFWDSLSLCRTLEEDYVNRHLRSPDDVDKLLDYLAQTNRRNSSTQRTIEEARTQLEKNRNLWLARRTAGARNQSSVSADHARFSWVKLVCMVVTLDAEAVPGLDIKLESCLSVLRAARKVCCSYSRRTLELSH